LEVGRHDTLDIDPETEQPEVKGTPMTLHDAEMDFPLLTPLYLFAYDTWGHIFVVKYRLTPADVTHTPVAPDVVG